MSALKTIAKAFGVATIVGSSSGAAYTWHVRDRNVKERRELLAAECDSLSADVRQLNAAIATERALAAQEASRAAKRQEVLRVLSADRLQRYETALDTARSAIDALPEGSTVLAGLVHHYGHMSKHMPMFAEYDALASRIHALGLLAAAASTARGIDGTHDGATECSPRRNSDVFRSMMHDDATADLVFRSFDNSDPADLPKSYAELSAVFQRTRGYLTDAIDAYNTRNRELAEQQAKQRARATGEYIPFSPGSPSAAARATLDVLRIEDDVAPTALSPEKSREARREQEAAAHQLKTRTDVLAALVHCDDVRSSVAKSAQWGQDPHIQRALAALDVWAAGAQRFLVDEQASRVFTCMASVMTHAITGVDQPMQESRS